MVDEVSALEMALPAAAMPASPLIGHLLSKHAGTTRCGSSMPPYNGFCNAATLRYELDDGGYFLPAYLS